MTRVQQIGIGLAAMLIIYLLMPTAQRNVMSDAPGLSSAFSPIGGQPVLAAIVPAKKIVTGEGLPLLSEPTITVEQIERVLAKYNSPAQGHGQEFYDLGKQYGINPAIALAFFVHESTAGSNPGWAGRKDDGTFTHNVGNIICAGYPTCYKGHRDYPSWRDGIEGWYRLITLEYIGGRNLSTVEQILPIYCPVGDGCAPDKYIALVNSMISEWQQ